MVPLTLGWSVRLRCDCGLPWEQQWPPPWWAYRTSGLLLLEPVVDASHEERVGVHNRPLVPLEQEVVPLFA